MARIIQLILTEDRRGTGRAPEDPVRRVIQLWTKDGRLVAEYDTHTEEARFEPDTIPPPYRS